MEGRTKMPSRDLFWARISALRYRSVGSELATTVDLESAPGHLVRSRGAHRFFADLQWY